MRITTIPVGMLGTNCYILETDEKSCAVIDPGAQPDKLISFIRENSLTPKYILLTHGHHDHIGAVKRIMSAFEGVALYIGAGDLEMLGDTQKSLAIFRSADDSDFIVGNAKTLSGGDKLGLDGLEIAVLDAPGHTRGGVAFICGDAMFSGDTLFREDVGRTDLYGGDFDKLKETLANLSAIEGDFIVYPGHGETTSLSHERQNNRYMPGGMA